MTVNLQNPLSQYQVAGYKPGDRIGGGVVVDPASLKPNELKETKQVTVDLNLNGKKDAQDDTVLVKLPPKGFVPADWKGPANWSFGDKVADAFGPAVGGILMGGLGGGLTAIATGNMANAGHFGAKLASSTNVGRIVAGTIALGVVVGAALNVSAYTSSAVVNDSLKARASAVPDMVQPKYILNQYLQQQPNTLPQSN